MKVVFASIAVVLALVLVSSACNNEDREDEPARNGQENVEPQGDNVSLADQFQSLVDSGAPVADLLVFLRENKEEAGEKQLSAMLATFEDKQHEQAAALTDRYFPEEETVQEPLWEWYEQHQAVPKPEEIDDEALRTLLTETAAGGYKVETAEGSFFPVIDYEVYREFQAEVTEDSRVYIDILAKESAEPAVKDAGLVIGWDEVTARARAMEQFVRTYPDSAKAEDMNRLFRSYVYITFQGIDNSPLFASEGGELLPEVRMAFAKAIEGDVQNSPYLQDLQAFMGLLDENGYKQTDPVKQYQNQKTAGILEEYEGEYADVNEE